LADVFISYARADEPVARRMAKALEAAGLDVWWDADLPAHRSYSEVIERNLADAKAVVVLWSKAAAASQWVRAEADFARNAGKLVQAQVDGTMPPMPFNQIQCADLKGWRGSSSHAGWAKLKGSAQALVSGEEPAASTRPKPRLWDRLEPYRWPFAALLALLVAVGVYFYAFGVPGESRKPVLAVLPFRSLDAQDESLVAGMWEDTRTAIGRNPQLIVLGPNTAQALAEKGEGAAKKAADYILEASVRTAGDKIRVSADLVRTKDGAQLWSRDFDRKLDDVFVLQSEIANEIEGRIRGRLAEKGGMTPEHIATSGEVYALYSDARAKIRKRDFGPIAADGRRELQKVLKMDPNFAPAWAALAEADQLVPPSQKDWSTTNNSEQYARKAIDLAPNLAAGHAALGFALGTGPVARSELERAVQLDPSDYAALNWLAGVLNDAGDRRGSIDALRRAAEIEPLFWPVVANLYIALKEQHDEAGIQELLNNEKRVGADLLGVSIAIDNAYSKGNLAEAVNIGLANLKSMRNAGPAIGGTFWTALMQLGFIEEAVKLNSGPDFAPSLWRNDPKGLDLMESHHIDTRIFFKMAPLTENASRVFLLSGRSKELADKYGSLKMTPEQFRDLVLADGEDHLVASAPLIALALRQNGQAADAAALLSFAESGAKRRLREQPLYSALLARIYAVEGRKEDALSLLASAVSRRWIPEPPVIQTDLHNDPALAALKGDPRFEKLRDRILGTIARERAQVNLSLLHQAINA
jgi:TolB-like protein/tetratricopeptide (TPR) repeat protein